MRLERGVLTASVNNGEPVQRGKDVPLTAGSLSVLATKPNANRRVDIVKPGVEIRVVQPWIKSSGVAGGYHAQRYGGSKACMLHGKKGQAAGRVRLPA